MIKRITILGTGMMGKQLAAFLLNSHLEVTLVKVSSSQNLQEDEQAVLSYIKKRLYEASYIQHFHFQSLEAYLEQRIDADLMIEAVVEDLEVKQSLLQRLSCQLGEHTFIATNTSSLSLEKIASSLNPDMTRRFLGLHFFAPVRQMPLVEVCYHSEFEEQYKPLIEEFVAKTLGKEMIIANDVLGFIANRIGFYANYDLMRLGEEADIGIEAIDFLSVHALKRSAMGPYALTDYTGLLLSDEAQKTYAQSKRDVPFFQERSLPKEMVNRSYFGARYGKGYYQIIEGKKLVINPKTYHYQAMSPIPKEWFERYKNASPKTVFHDIMVNNDSLSLFLRQVIENVLYYALIQVPFATENYQSIDKAMRYGYNWQLGPFEIWDLLGFNQVKENLQKRFGPLPNWLDHINGCFYAQNPYDSSMEIMQVAPNLIWDRPNQSSLRQTEDGVLLFSMATPKSVINPQLLNDLSEAIELLEESDNKGLVIHSLGKHFSVGYDIKLMSRQIEEKTLLSSLQDQYPKTHELLKALRFSKKPIISALHGKALGGGAEIAMLSSEVLADVNLKIGLVEYGIGLLPGGGSLAYLAETVLMSSYSRAQKKTDLVDRFLLVSGQKVSNNAYEAVRLGLLKANTTIVKRQADLVELAISRVLFLDKAGYIPVEPQSYRALGNEFIAIMKGMIANYRAGGFISAAEVPVLEKLAFVLGGGSLPMGTKIDFEHLLNLEKECFLQLLSNPDTIEKLSQFAKP